MYLQLGAEAEKQEAVAKYDQFSTSGANIEVRLINNCANTYIHTYICDEMEKLKQFKQQCQQYH